MTNVIDMTRGVYRRVYSGFITGKRLCSVSIEAEAWFWRLYVLADDFGNLAAEPVILRNHAAGLRDIAVAQSEAWIGELAEANLITVYECAGDRYIHFAHFEDLQPAPRNGRRIQRCPKPDGASGGIRGNPGESGGSEADAQSQAEADAEAHARGGGGGNAHPLAERAYDALRAKPWDISPTKAKALCEKHRPEAILHAITLAKGRKGAGGGLLVRIIDSGDAERDLSERSSGVGLSELRARLEKARARPPGFPQRQAMIDKLEAEIRNREATAV